MAAVEHKERPQIFTLTVRAPSGTETDYSFDEKRPLIVGRDELSDVVLDSKQVSRRHARFYVEDRRPCVEDLGSQNGIYVGGARIAGWAEVDPGIAVDVGDHRCTITRGPPRESSAPKPVPVPDVPSAVLRREGGKGGEETRLGEHAVVGRDAASTVMLDDDSVSRKHAEIRRENDFTYWVRDLGSANGTFVNDHQVKGELEIDDGDLVRFGDIEMRFAMPPGVRRPAAPQVPSRRRNLLVAVGAGMILFFALAWWVRQAPPEEEPGPEPQETSRDRAERLTGRGQELLREDKWTEAAKAFSEALDLDPISEDARKGLRKARREAETQKTVELAETRAQVGAEAEAFTALTTVDRDSRYYPRARLRVQELAGELVKSRAQECRQAGRAGKPPAIADACGKYLSLKCHSGEDAQALKWLRAAEAKLKGAAPWNCPEELKAWLGGAETGPDPVKELGGRYPDAQLRDAALAYVRGEMDAARRALDRLRKDPRRRAAAGDLSEKINLVDGRYREGHSAFLRGEVAQAVTLWEEALGVDEKLVPATLTSFYARQMRTTLASHFAKQGQQEFDWKRYPEAYEAWSKSLRYNPNDASSRDGLARLEKVAETLVATASSCDDLERALKITRADPPSPSHQKTTARLDAECR